MALRSRIRPLRAPGLGRDQPLIFSAIFFTSSSIGIGLVPVSVFGKSGRARVHRPALAQVLHELRKCETVEHALRHTRCAGTPPFRAISTPQCVRSISRVECASGLMLTMHPSSSARSCQRQSRSRRQGLALISTATPYSAQASRILSTSTP